MSIDPKISLIIPILNEASSLPELLSSIKRQTFLPDEIIFCDAGSTDAGPKFIQEWWSNNSWCNTSLKIIMLPGAMPGAGRNAGIRNARNNWIAFLDGGIIPHEEWLKSLCIFAQNTQSEAVFGICHFSGDTPFARAICALSYGQGSSHPVIPASLFAKSIFEKVGYFPDQLRAGEDILWLRQFLLHYQFRQVCLGAMVSYSRFPDGWLRAMIKWRIYEFHCVQAGVRVTQQYLYLFTLPAVLFLIFYQNAYAWILISVYFIFRGIIDPIRRSELRPWWGNSLYATLIAPILAFLLDISKWIGIVQGMISKFFRKTGWIR
jgi:glycosyltransferase involved in cell wall biosynthesis